MEQKSIKETLLDVANALDNESVQTVKIIITLKTPKSSKAKVDDK